MTASFSKVAIAIEARGDNGASAAAAAGDRESNEVRSRLNEEANSGYFTNTNRSHKSHRKRPKNRKRNKKKEGPGDNFVGYFAARKLQKSTRRALNAARRRNFR